MRVPLVRRLLFAATCLFATGFTLMWLAGLFTYSTVGIDHDNAEGDQVLEGFYRLRWPGDGSLWIGAAGCYRPLGNKPADFIDLGSKLFDRPTRVPPRSFLNRIGFWLVTGPADDPFANKLIHTVRGVGYVLEDRG